MIKFTCPFCIHTYPKYKVLHVCPDCNKADPSLFHAFYSRKCPTDGCGGRTIITQCPKCGETIPKTALETPNLPFSIVGVHNSGKTNYITVMLHELSRAQGLPLALGHQTAETLARQNENKELIFDRHQVPPVTNPGDTPPQIWYVKNLQKKTSSSVPTYTFTVFDGAGEDLENNLDPSSTVCRYINSSKAIILAVDPLILQNVRKGGVVDPEIMRNSLNGEDVGLQTASDIINGVAQYIKSARNIASTKKLKIPVAVVLMKFDTILNHPAFGQSAIVRNSSLTLIDGKVNLSEIQQVDGEIRNWLLQIGEGGFISTIESHFSEYYFFGVSSYGAPPINRTTLPNEIHPHRVLDPILWLFQREGFLD
jgi:hypothetical protein